MRIPDLSEPGTLSAEAGTSVLAEAVDRIAHQLKNPLQAMTVNLEVIRLRARQADREELERVTGVVDENIRRVDRRIRMLIALARRSPEETSASVDLAEVAREAGAAFRLDDREDGLGLRMRLPDSGKSEGTVPVRVRRGELLALILAAASRVEEAASGGERPYLSVEPDEAGAALEVGPAAPWRGEEEAEELIDQARRAGGEVAGGGGRDPTGAEGPFRVLFPRS